MGILFGKKKPPSRVTEQDKAILVRRKFNLYFQLMFLIFFQQLKQQRDRLKQYQKRIELALTKDRELAKKLISNGQKEWVKITKCEFPLTLFFCSRAKLLLKKKRFQEQLLLKADGQLENLEKLTHDIEFAQVELQVVQGLKLGNEALKKVNDALNIEDIESILDETREGIEKQNVSITSNFFGLYNTVSISLRKLMHY